MTTRFKKIENVLLDLATRKDRCMYIYQNDLKEALIKNKIFTAKKIQDVRMKKMSEWYTPPKRNEKEITQKILFEGKTKVSTSWAGTQIQTKSFKDKFGKVKVGEWRCCHITTKWGSLGIPNYIDMNKYGNKKIKITVEIVKEAKKK